MKKHISILLTAVMLTLLCTFPAQADSDHALIGDADLDGELTVLDATRIQRSLAKLCILSPLESYLGDADGDRDLSITDATLIQRRIARLDAPFYADTIAKWKAKLERLTADADEPVALNTAVTFTAVTTERPVPETFRYIVDGQRMADGVSDNRFTYTFTTPGVHELTAIAYGPFGGASAATVTILVIDPDALKPVIRSAVLDNTKKTVSVTAAGGTAPYQYRYIIRRADPPAPGHEAQSSPFIYRTDENGEYYLLLDFCDESEVELPIGNLSPRLSYQMEIWALDSRGGLSAVYTIPVSYTR